MASLLLAALALLLLGASRIPRFQPLRNLSAGFAMVAFSGLVTWALMLAEVPEQPWIEWARLVCLLSITYVAARAGLLLLFDWLLVQRFGVPIPRLARDVIALLVYLIIGATILQAADIQVSALLATSAVLTVIIGLALQETLGTLLSGLALAWEQRLSTGSWIEIEGKVGRIEELGWRSLVIRTRLGERILIPNSSVARATIRLLGNGAAPVAVPIRLGVAYGEPPDLVRNVLLKVCHDHPLVVSRPPPKVYTVEFADSAVVYECRLWTRKPWQDVELSNELLTRAHAALRRAGMEIPFPQRTFHLGKPKIDDRQALSIEALSNCELFADLDTAALADLVSRSTWLRFSPDESIVVENDASRAMYVIATGEAEVLRGKKKIGDLKAGDVFGEIAFLTDTARTATVRARGEITVVEVDSIALAALLETREQVAEELAQRMAVRQQQLEDAGRAETKQPRAGLVESLRDHLSRLVRGAVGDE
jgi:small-conductance mechanosensitive channel/CRP-like cAMP-binding protein